MFSIPVYTGHMELNYWDGITQTITYLRSRYGWRVVIKDFVGFLGKESAIASSVGLCISHECEWCMKLKTHDALWDRCQRGNTLLRDACARQKGWFIGSAWCGVPEFVFPVFYGDQVIGAVCVGGFYHEYTRNLARARRAVSLAGSSPSLLDLWEKTFTANKADTQAMAAASGAIGAWLTLYYTQLREFSIVREGEIYRANAAKILTLSHAMAFIRSSWKEEIHAADIARFCHCSVSHLSHLFKKNLQRSITEVIEEERLTRAKRMLADTDMRITDIAMACGFGDPNYFSFVFHRESGTTPSAFRASIRKGRSLP